VQGFTLLHYAVIGGYADAAAALMSLGADVNAKGAKVRHADRWYCSGFLNRLAHAMLVPTIDVVYWDGGMECAWGFDLSLGAAGLQQVCPNISW